MARSGRPRVGSTRESAGARRRRAGPRIRQPHDADCHTFTAAVCRCGCGTFRSRTDKLQPRRWNAPAMLWPVRRLLATTIAALCLALPLAVMTAAPVHAAVQDFEFESYS